MAKTLARPSSSEASDRSLAIALGVSLIGHTMFLGVQLIRLQGTTKLPRPAPPLDVVYEHQAQQEELRRMEHQLAELKDRPALPSGPPGLPSPVPQIRIPERPAMAFSPLQPGIRTSRTAVVDLTNLVDAAQGDAVLLSYFSAIREQIQKTANRQTWLTGQAIEGVVYVSFLLDAKGQVHEATVLSDRSVPSRALQEIAVRIIKAASPFVPFPPSVSEPSKTIVVPLEFLIGS